MREISSTGLTSLLPFAELCLGQVPRGQSVLLGALQKLLGGQKACVLTLATCLWQSRDAVVSASGLVPQVCPGTPRDSRPHGGLHLVQGPGWTQGPAWTHGRGAVVPNTRDCAGWPCGFPPEFKNSNISLFAVTCFRFGVYVSWKP